MDIKKHKELFDFISAKSSYNGFMNYRNLVCVLKKFNCYDEFLNNVNIETLEKKNNFETNSDILKLAFWWEASDRGDRFWRIMNIIYISLMIIDEEYRRRLYYKYEFAYCEEFEYLNFIYYFGVEKSDRIFHLLNSVYKKYLFQPIKLKFFFYKNINIINKMKEIKFKNDKELEKFLNSNGIF